MHLYLYNRAAVPLGVVDVERNVVLSLDACTALVIYPDILSLKAQLEEFTLGDGNLHTSMPAGYFGLKDLIICNQIPKSIISKDTVTSQNSNVEMTIIRFQHQQLPPVFVGNSGQPHRSPPFSSSQVMFVQISPAHGS